MFTFRKAIRAGYMLFVAFNKNGLQMVANGEFANRLLLYKIKDVSYNKPLQILSVGVICQDVNEIVKLRIPHLNLSIYDKQNVFGCLDHKLTVHIFTLPNPRDLEQVTVGHNTFTVLPNAVELNPVWKEFPI